MFFFYSSNNKKKLWTPAKITTAAWLDASDASTITLNGSTVSQWSDKSGNGYNATQPTASNQPTYLTTAINNKAVVSFDNSDGVNNRLIITNPLVGATSVSVFFVAKSDTDPPLLVTQGGAPVYQFGEDILGDHSPWTDGNVYSGFGSTVRKSVGNPATSLANPTLHSIHSATNAWTYNINAVTQYTTNTNTVGYGNSPRLGTSWKGYLAEVILLRYVPDTDTMQRTEGYLAHKWGLTASLPANHPYKNTAPMA